MAARRALGPRGEPSRAPLGAAAVSYAHSGMGGAGTKGAPLALLSQPPRVLTPGGDDLGTSRTTQASHFP